MDLYNASMGNEEESPIELTLEQYEEAKAHYGTIIERADAARRLADNDDFKALVMSGYLTDEPQRLAELIASGRLNEKVREDCSRQLVSIGDFRGYMKNIIEQGQMARDELASLEEARDEAIKNEEAAAG
jgi:hypothetical protein